MIKANDILKAVLMLRRYGNKSNSKEEQIAEQKEWIEKGYYTEESFYGWIDSLREELKKTPEQREEENRIACEEMAERETEWKYRDEWDELWSDRAREVGAVWC